MKKGKVSAPQARCVATSMKTRLGEVLEAHPACSVYWLSDLNLIETNKILAA